MNADPLAIKPREVLRKRTFGGISVSEMEAFPMWKVVLPANANPTDTEFKIAAGSVLTIPLEFPVDSMIRFLWGRFLATVVDSGARWSTLCHTPADTEDLREDNDFLRWLDIRLVLDSAAGVEIIEWTPLALLQGADEFGRVRLPYLLGKQATVTVELRNRFTSDMYVSGYLHGWRIKL